MILFIAEYPNSENMREGMMQRIAFIDSLLSQYERQYVFLLPHKHLKPTFQIIDGVKFYTLNTFLHIKQFLKLVNQAKLIYVHSLLNGFLGGWAYLQKNKKIVTDFHGIVPEEFMYMKKPLEAWVSGFFEPFMLKKSLHFISVTRAMNQHYREKYNQPLENMSLVPIFNAREPVDRSIQTNSPPAFIYAGGLQAWQNIDLMLELFQAFKNTDYQLTLLVPHIEACRAVVERYNLLDRVRIDSVPREKISIEYLKHDLGLVLRQDHVVNRVALPTKLVEYLEHGLVPVVLQPRIGDFLEYDYQYVLLEDLLLGKFDFTKIPEMRAKNYLVYQQFCEDNIKQIQIFKAQIKEWLQ